MTPVHRSHRTRGDDILSPRNHVQQHDVGPRRQRQPLDQAPGAGAGGRHRRAHLRVLLVADETHRGQEHTVDRHVRAALPGRGHRQFGGHRRGHQVSLHEKVSTSHRIVGITLPTPHSLLNCDSCYETKSIKYDI